MTTVVSRRPTSTISTLNLGLFGAAVSAHANLADDNDATYVRLFDSAGGNWNFQVAFNTATITADQYVARYRVRMRIAYDNPGLPNIPIVANWRVYIQGSTGLILAQPDLYTSVFFGTQDPHNVYGAWKQPSPELRRAWTGTDLVTPRVYVSGYTNNNNFYPRILAMWLEHEVRNRPTTAVTAPSGPQTVSTQPATVFSYDSIDGVPPTGYQLKIFSAAQYGAGGFDPETSTPTYNSGVVRTEGLTVPSGVRPTVPLVNGVTYKSYVQVRNAGTFNAAYTPKSDWENSPAYNINVNDPAVPGISAVLNTPRAQIDLTVQGHQNMLSYDAASFEVATGGWTGHTNATIARSTAKFADGSASLRVTATAGGDAVAAGPFILVDPATTYMARAQVAANATTRNARVGIDWYNAVFGFVSSSNGPSTAEAGTTFPGTTLALSSPVAVPATAFFARVTVTFLACAASEQHYIDKVALKPGNDNSWTRGGLADVQYVDILRSLDGAAYETVRSQVPVDPTTQLLLWSDGTTPNGIAATYKVKSSSYDTITPEDALDSAESSATGALTVTATEWWLRDIQEPDDSIMVSVIQPDLEFNEREEMAEYNIIGRMKPVIISDVITGMWAPLRIDFLTHDDYLLFRELRRRQKTLLIKSPLVDNQQWYIRIRADVRYNMSPNGTGDIYCTARMEVIEQDVPTF